ncbi:conjugal transfer protein TraD [Allosphingosinicella sp.]|uniref:conjugal transfer protein TraD n=1 Tax=Allosphingosinicella sp. TaxID=2823234 RepID=UPI002FC0E931
MKRRERTRQLIELGGLVVKSGLVELTDDDRPAMFGLLLEGAAKLRSSTGNNKILLWRRRGQRGFGRED